MYTLVDRPFLAFNSTANYSLRFTIDSFAALISEVCFQSYAGVEKRFQNGSGVWSALSRAICCN